MRRIQTLDLQNNLIWRINKKLENSTIKCDLLSGLIVDGVEAKVNEFPHMGAIYYSNDFKDGFIFGCGASLISETFLISAAHCQKMG